jgi:aspartate aminotransferase
VYYDGDAVYQKYKNQKPRTHSERLNFVKDNAPKVVSGLDMIATFFENLKSNIKSDLQTHETSMKITI